MSLSETSAKPASPETNAKLVASGKDLKLPTAILAIASHPAGKKVFAACLDGGIYEIVIESGAYKRLAKHASYASGVQYLSKFDRLISAGYDGALRWHHPAEESPIRTVQAHKFWSWKMRVSPDQQSVATVTGQYLVGGYKYEPSPELEPSVKVFDSETGELRWALPHLPPVLSVAFSRDSRHIAGANMMGEVRVWDLQTGKQVGGCKTPDFTSWGIIKSHHYIGGIFDLVFSPDNRELLLCGMGPMVDPMAGNGKQTWQRFTWNENPPRKTAEIKETDAGHGLMEVIDYHPANKMFLMAGRLAQGKWNTALFDSESGHLVYSLDTKMRATSAAWLNNGTQLILGGATSQERKKDGRYADFGHLKIFEVV